MKPHQTVAYRSGFCSESWKSSSGRLVSRADEPITSIVPDGLCIDGGGPELRWRSYDMLFCPRQHLISAACTKNNNSTSIAQHIQLIENK